jgi:GAF domain-containing protein
MTALPPDVVADLEQENARLQAELRAMQDRQAAGAEILRTIASASGDAGRSLQQIAETSARLFGAPSVSLQLVDNGEWGQAFRFGTSAVQVRSAVPLATIRIGGPNLPGTVVAENRQIHIPDLDNLHPSMADWPGPPHARATGTRTMCGTPLRREGKAIGVLIVYRDRLLPFTEEELALQQSFADQAVIAIENARLFNETKEALARQTATSDILRVINNSAGNLGPVFESILENAHRLCGAPCGSLQLYERDRVVPVAIRGMTTEFAEFLRAGYPITEAIREGLFANRPIQRIDMAEFLQSHSDEPSLRAAVELGGIGTMVTVPLAKNGAAFGRIVAARQEVNAFSDKQIALLQGFADQAVIAIENARLFNETKETLERQTATADILKVIASSPSDVQPVFDVIVERAVRLCGGRMGRVDRYDDGIVHMVAGYGLSEPGLNTVQQMFPTPAADDTTAGRAIQSRRPNFVADIESDQSVPPLSRQMIEALETRSQVTVPMLRRGEPIGAITVGWAEPGAYGDQQVTLLQTFADQAVIAIENVRLFNETKEALERQTATADILKVIASSPSDAQPVFAAIAASANRLIGGFSSTVFRFMDGIAYLKAFTPTTAAADEILKATFPRPVADFPPFQMAQAGEVTQIPDTEALSDEILDISRARGFRSMLFAPLMNDGVSIGFIAVTRVQPGTFADHHVELLRTFADQAVIAIENARLFQEVQAKTSDLTEALTYQTGSGNILRVIASSPTDVVPVLQAIVESACELCEAADALVALKDGDDLVFQAQHGSIPVVWKRTPINRQLPSGLAVIDRRPVYVHDLLSIEGEQLPDAREFAERTNVRTVLSVPLLRENESIGAIVLRRTEVQPFSDKQISLLQTFADQAVIAIGNVRLFEQVQEQTRELSQSLDELRIAQDRLVQTEKLASLGQLTAGIAHEIKNPLNFVNNFAALSAELTDELNEVLKPTSLAGNVREEVDELTSLLKDNLQKVVQHGKRADSIVKNMLLHSRGGSGEHRPADINALLDESLNLAYHGARAEKPQFNVTLRRDFDAMAGTIELFPQEITRVLLNLISNGFYAVKRKTENDGSGFEPVLSAATRNLGDTVEIRIRDNGTGIPPEVREKMFNPFFTTKPAGEGTGLGLSMSHDIIVKQHGGRIEVETVPGEFTEFRIVLPRTSNVSDKNRGQT